MENSSTTPERRGDQAITRPTATIPTVPQAETLAGARGTAFDWGALKAAGSFLGIVGTGGGGFVALSFGIGYLAVRNHDEMVGLPTTSLTATTYVRIGALFFPKSLYYVLSSNVLLVVLIGTMALSLWLVGRLGRRDSRGFSWVQQFGRRAVSSWLEPILFALACVALFFLGFYGLQAQVAALDAENRDVLFKDLKHGSSQTSTGAKGLGSSGFSRQGAGGLALQISGELQRIDGVTSLQERYGRQTGLVLLMGFGLVVVHRWRQRLKESAKGSTGTEEKSEPGSFFLVGWVAYPLLGALLAALLVNLPATYGVLCFSNAGKWVVVFDAAHANGESGYLLSDLSSEATELWILGYEATEKHWVLRVFKRDGIQNIRLVEANNTPNILAKELKKP